MEYKLNKLKNGVRLITVELPSLESMTVTVWVKVGSRYEPDKIAGISHFLEHMVFKGSKKRPTAKDISVAIDSIGGEFNAGTSKEWTNFYIKARTGVMETAIDVLSDMVLRPFLRQDDIDREKGVILEEMALYEDTPISKVGDVFENLIYSGNSLGRDIIGHKDSVRKMKTGDFATYRKKHYASENVVITVSGNIKTKAVIDLCNNYFSEFKKDKRDEFDKYKADQKKPQVKLKSQKIEQAHLIIAFRGEKRGHDRRFDEVILSTILNGGMSSRMFTEIREKRGLAYAVRSADDHTHETGYLGSQIGADIRRVDEAIKVSLDQFYGLAEKRYEIDDDEMEKAKEFVKGHLALSLEDTTDINSFFGLKELLLGKIETPEEIYKKIDKVDKEGVYKLAKEFFKPERLNLAIIGPYNSQTRFEKLLT